MNTKISKTSFIEVMGSSPTIRVLDFLIENDRTSWSMNEICKNANIGYTTLKYILPKLLAYNIIITIKQLGKIKLYAINKNTKITKKIIKLHTTITLELARKCGLE